MSPRHVKMSGRHVALSETHILAFFSGNMSERHVKMSGRHLGMIFSQGLWETCQDAWETSWDFCPARCLGDMLTCLGDILAFFQARCLRGMLRFLMQTPRHCFQRDMLRCLGDIFLARFWETRSDVWVTSWPFFQAKCLWEMLRYYLACEASCFLSRQNVWETC